MIHFFFYQAKNYINLRLVKQFLLFNIALASVINFSHAQNYQTPVQSLMAKTKTTQAVPVIVTVKQPVLPIRPNAGIGKSASELIRQTNRQAIDHFVGKLTGKNLLSPTRKMKYLPQFIVTVNEQGLKQILSDPDVVSIQEDIPEPVNLGQSRDIVYDFSGNITSSPYRGQGQFVAILDTGVDSDHAFFGGASSRVTMEACFSGGIFPNSSTSLCPGGVTQSTAAGSGQDCGSINGCNHGTHVAGIAAGFSSNTFSGVAFESNIIAIQVFSRFTGAVCQGVSPCVLAWTSDQVEALDYLVGLVMAGTINLASVNMSLGGGQFTGFCDTDSRKPAIDMLRTNSVAVVISSGNNGFTNAVGSPGCISTAITVGATEDNASLRERSFYSNEGQQVDLYAPGGDSSKSSFIFSSVPGGGFANFQGTSMAAPHVAGAVAVLKNVCPSLTVNQIENALKSTGEFVDGANVSFARSAQLDQAILELKTNVCPINAPSASKFYPITPCRVVDTRNTFLSLPILFMSSKAFKVSGTGFDAAVQGGTTGCSVPASATAVATNITYAGSDIDGFLTAYPYPALQPNSSILNFRSSAIANSTILPICNSDTAGSSGVICDEHFYIYASKSAHVVVDLLGYYE